MTRFMRRITTSAAAGMLSPHPCDETSRTMNPWQSAHWALNALILAAHAEQQLPAGGRGTEIQNQLFAECADACAAAFNMATSDAQLVFGTEVQPGPLRHVQPIEYGVDVLLPFFVAASDRIDPRRKLPLRAA